MGLPGHPCAPPRKLPVSAELPQGSSRLCRQRTQALCAREAPAGPRDAPVLVPEGTAASSAASVSAVVMVVVEAGTGPMRRGASVVAMVKGCQATPASAPAPAPAPEELRLDPPAPVSRRGWVVPLHVPVLASREEAGGQQQQQQQHGHGDTSDPAQQGCAPQGAWHLGAVRPPLLGGSLLPFSGLF